MVIVIELLLTCSSVGNVQQFVCDSLFELYMHI